MLIFTRRIGEAVVIGDNEVNVTIIGVKGNQVRLGFIASQDIPIHRHEIYLKVKKEEEQGGFYVKPVQANDNANNTLN